MNIFFPAKKGHILTGHRDGLLPRDASVFGDTSREPAAFPADKFHGPDYLVKHRRDFGTLNKVKVITETLFSNEVLPPQGSNVLLPGLPLHFLELLFVRGRLQGCHEMNEAREQGVRCEQWRRRPMNFGGRVPGS